MEQDTINYVVRSLHNLVAYFYMRPASTPLSPSKSLREIYMRDNSSFRQVFVVGYLSLLVFCVGCGGPYYTMKGSMTAKTLTVHDGEKEIKVDVGTAMGGALSGDAVSPDGTFSIEKDGVTVEGTVDPTGRVAVDNVVYKGQKLGLGSMTEI